MKQANVCLSITLCLLAIVSSACAPTEHPAPIRILFVGNSLTYVGNLPAVLEALSASNGKSVSVEMLVKGGATLAERANDSSVEREMSSARYDFVVLQERGGDVFCFFGDASSGGNDCGSSKAHIELGRVVLAHGAKPIVLGTYQSLDSASQTIEKRESALAKQMGALYIPVSESFRLSQTLYTDYAWFNADKMHPGPDLVLLEAVWLYSAIFDSPPTPQELTVAAPIFGPGAHFVGSSLASTQAVAAPATRYTYTMQRVADIVRIGTLPVTSH